jgi:D-alanine-D-alanine ligase
MPHICVLYNLPVLPPGDPDAVAEVESVETAQIVAEILKSAGYRVTLLGLDLNPQPLLDLAARDRPDAVFNLFEGLASASGTEAVLAGLLDWLGIPYTGCPPLALTLCRDKPRAKLLMQAAGIPTPAFVSVTALPCPAWPHGWPALVKPGSEDASVGLDHDCVVADQPHLERQVKRLLDRYAPPALVEEFIPGREFNLGVIADPQPRVLPLAEIVFAPPGPGRWPIVTYEAKWVADSQDDRATRPVCPAEADPALAERLRELALQAFRLFGCRHYARCDFRVDPQGKPYLLEVNPNPDIHPEAGLARALGVAGISHPAFISGLATAVVGKADGGDCWTFTP